TTLRQCGSHNAELLSRGTSLSGFDFTVDARERFATSMKTRNYASVLFNPLLPQVVEQNILGFPYNTETGFFSPSLFTPTPGLGLADFGTRILLRFSPIGIGTHLFVPVSPALTDVNTGHATGLLRRLMADSNGNSLPGYVAMPPTGSVGGVPVSEVSYENGTAYAVYEVVSSN